MMRVGIWPALAVLMGLTLFTIVIAWLGWRDVIDALAQISVLGFVEYLLAQGAIVVGLAMAWRVLLRNRNGGNFWLLFWGRLVRDAAGEFLPFSHLGGFVLGGRAITLGGVGFADAAASTLADVTVEFLSELVFITIGLVVLAVTLPGQRLILPISIGLAIALISGGAFVFVQQGGSRLFRALATRIAGQSGDAAALRADRLQTALDQIYAEPYRLLGAGALHLACWFGTGVAGYVAFHALGAHISLLQAIAIESMLHAILAAGFFVPGRVGVQEAAYTLLGAAFGVPPDIALSVSLLRRARDLIIAVPVLLVWQGIEARRLHPISTRS